MAIRVFINQWTERADGGLVQITDAIDTYLNDVSLSDPNTLINNFVARRALDHRPDKIYRIKVIRGNLTATEWTTLASLPGCHMVPPGRFDDPVSSIKTPVKTKIYAVLDSMGIPRTTFDSASSIGGFLRNMLAELGGAKTDFGALELSPAEWA